MSTIETVKFLGDVEVAGSLTKDGKEILTGADLSAPDWNQNDSTASDYVKNRTHYSILANIEKEQTVEPMWYNESYVYWINYDASIKIKDLPLKTLIKYEIWSEGSLLLSGELLKTKDSHLVGNQWLSDPEGGHEDSGEDVAIYDINNSVIAFRYAGTLESCVIKIAYDGIIQLDEKYIPTALHSDLNNNSISQKDTKAMGQNSAALGLNTLAGSKAFTIQSMYVNEDNKIVFELDDVTGLEEEQNFSVFLYKDDAHSEQYENFGTITYIKGKTVGTDKSPEDFKFVGITQQDSYIGKDGYDTEANSFRIIDRPDLGTRTIGANTFAVGVNTKVLSKNSAGFGDGNLSYGSHSFVAGKNNQVGFAATAFGRNNHSSGDVTTSFGQQNAANGYVSLATGANTTASGIASSSFGTLTEASGNKSSAFGGGTTASGENSVATGNKTTASGKDSVSIGQETIASGEDSLAVGKLSQATGLRSIAGGFKTESTGGNAVSFGNMTKATGTHSIAIGDQTIAEGEASFAEGRQTIAKRRSQHVYGEFNIADSEGTANYNRGKYVHIVGNGTADNKRSNAHTLDWNGNAWFAGNITIGEDKKSLATEDFVRSLIEDVLNTEV